MRIRVLLLSALLMGGVAAGVFAAHAVVPGTPVTLVFDQAVSSSTAEEGQRIRLHVASDVVANGATVIKKGAPVTGIVVKAEERKPFGINATLRLALSPVESTRGVWIPLQPRSEGQPVGTKTGAGAAATVGGAAVLGPVGLVAGYFVSGEAVEIKEGDKLETEVAEPGAGLAPVGTPVTLVFDQALSSSIAKEGQKVKLHVASDVMVNGQTVIKKGARVTGTIARAEERKRYGVNATLRIAPGRVKSVRGTMIPLEPRSQGQPVGTKTGTGAAATVGGAAVLGPVGLIAGYFVSGKAVHIKVGDKLETEVAAH